MRKFRIMWAQWRLRRVEKSVQRSSSATARTALVNFNRLSRARERLRKAKYP